MPDPVIEVFPGGPESAFAAMMAELIRTNLADRPEKARDFTKMYGRVALIAEDAQTAATLRFRGGKLSAYPGLFGIPDLVVRGPSEALLDMSRLPMHPKLPFLPDPRADVTRSLARALVERRLRIYGLLENLGLGLRLGRVLSIY